MACLVEPKRTLTTEEIASNGIDARDIATARPFVDPLPRVAVEGRHLAVTQELRQAGSTPAPRTHGPNAQVAVHFPCKEDEDGSSPSGSTGPAARPFRRSRSLAFHADVAELVDAPASEAGGPGP
jgi:hypothetical protein